MHECWPVADHLPMLPKCAAPLFGCVRCFPKMNRQRSDVERQAAAFPSGDHRGKATSQGIAKLEKTIRPRTGDISQNNAAAMQLDEDFLIKSGLLVGLIPVNNTQPVTQLSLYDRLDDSVKEILHVRIIFVLGIQQTHRERPRSLQRFHKFDYYLHLIGCRLSRRESDTIDPIMGVAIIGDLEKTPTLAAREAKIVQPPCPRGFRTEREIERYDRLASVVIEIGQEEDALRAA